MNSLQDLIEEAKTRTVLWAIFIFVISYFLSHTSKSMWMNIPISFLILAAFRYLSYELELKWRVRPDHKQTYLSHLSRKQLPLSDSRISTLPPTTSKWRRKIDSPYVEAAVNDFINKVLQDFVVDLWYSSITPDKESPELMRNIILDVIGEISGRIKDVNLVDLLTRDVVDLIGNHLDLYRKCQSEIGVKVMGTLSFEERDEKLKQHLMASKELHPALISLDCEHKVLQRLVGGILAVVMKPQEAKSPLVRCISRELLTCLVLQPVMNLASPMYINELIEYAFLTSHNDVNHDANVNTSSTAASSSQDNIKQPSDMTLAKNSAFASEDSQNTHQKMLEDESKDVTLSKPADWAVVLEAATKRRSQVLAPENLENMWTKGRNYQKKSLKLVKNSSGVISNKYDRLEDNSINTSKDSNVQLKRSNSTPDLNTALTNETVESMACKESNTQLLSHSEGSLQSPKLRCKVVGAYFEKIGTKSFAVYSIAVTDVENKTWVVKRRYRNFERLHRHLKDIPNYSLHLPPKRFLSSSIDDYFVHQRCILLDKYLQDLLSIANVAEQHEVWDFLSSSSKSYSFGKSPSVMKTLAVNVDDAVDDIVRQFKGVSGGLRRKVVSPSPENPLPPQISEKRGALICHDDETNKISPSYSNMESSRSISGDEVADEDQSSSAAISGWHSDNELNSKDFRPHSKKMDDSKSMDSQRSQPLDNFDKVLSSKSSKDSNQFEDPEGMPPGWNPTNVSVPLLNLVDKTFQLNRRGWLRRQVFWISKQILQLMMEDAIDDWILRQIHCLRNEEVIAYAIRWIHNILWPNGTFFIKLRSTQTENTSSASDKEMNKPSSFELQLEAARRASDIKKIILGGPPAALVSLIGNKQYQKSAKDIYYFLQSNICIQQLAYSALELVVVSIFPELRDLIQDIHDKARAESLYDQ